MGGDSSCYDAVGTFSTPLALVEPSTFGRPRAVVLIEKVGPAVIELFDDPIFSVFKLLWFLARMFCWKLSLSYCLGNCD